MPVGQGAYFAGCRVLTGCQFRAVTASQIAQRLPKALNIQAGARSRAMSAGAAAKPLKIEGQKSAFIDFLMERGTLQYGTYNNRAR